MWMSNPNVGPNIDLLKIARDGSVTMLLNGPRPSLLRSENMNALTVEPKLKSDPEKQKYFSSAIEDRQKRLAT